jgi:HEAT repeat protein
MAKAMSTEEALRAIRAIRDAPENFDLKRDLAPFLRHKSNHVAAAAASTAERLEAAALTQDLVEAFGELMKDPAKRDPGCKALVAMAKALVALDEPAAKVYFAGIGHVQMEGSFGPPVDAAAPLRGLCAQGLARMGHADALLECVTLLADKEVPARVGAVRAIGDSGDVAGALLLRLKALLGDEEIEVTGECFASLLRLAPVAASVEFVAQYLRSDSDEVRERAALALGESRLAAAFPVLREAWEQTAQAERRRVLLLSMAMVRLDEAVEFLMGRVAEDREPAAADALAALALYGRDEAVRKRVEELVARRASAGLREAFEREFSQ